MKFEVLNRWSAKVQFTAEIDCAEDASASIKLGLAVKWAIKTHANLAGANLAGANLADANLAGAYLARANLADANLAGVYLADANLAGAYLARANLAGAYLAGANLAGAYLADAYLAGAYLADANLAGAYLAGAYLARANLADANLAGAPIIPNIDDAILAAIEAGGTLDMNGWHGPERKWCGTTHCRAGWAIHLAGGAGRKLEIAHGSAAAGALIYAASRPGKPIPNFYASNADALADLRKCAAEQNPDRTAT